VSKPFVKYIDVFVRTAVWFVDIANNYGNNHAYTDSEKEAFRGSKKELVAHAKNIENQINGDWNLYFSGSKEQQVAQEVFKQRMAEHIKDERLLEGFTPKWSVGCRRVSPGDPYMKAIQQPNVDVHFTGVERVTKEEQKLVAIGYTETKCVYQKGEMVPILHKQAYRDLGI
jgi:hydroxyversicolorone monooxygenase